MIRWRPLRPLRYLGHDRIVPSGAGGRYPGRWSDLVVPDGTTPEKRRYSSKHLERKAAHEVYSLAMLGKA